MDDILDISLSSRTYLERSKERTRGYKITSEQWPRIYNTPIEQSIENKYWELRSYSPQVI